LRELFLSTCTEVKPAERGGPGRRVAARRRRACSMSCHADEKEASTFAEASFLSMSIVIEPAGRGGTGRRVAARRRRACSISCRADEKNQGNLLYVYYSS